MMGSAWSPLFGPQMKPATCNSREKVGLDVKATIGFLKKESWRILMRSAWSPPFEFDIKDMICNSR